MKKPAATTRPLLSTLAGLCLAALTLDPAARAQTTITFEDGQPAYTDARTTTVADPLTFTITDGAATQSGPIGGGGSLTKIGSGSITLTATNTYTGGTVVNAGVLAVDNDGETTFGTLGGGTTTISGDSGSGLAGTLQFLTNSSAGGGVFTLSGGTTGGGYGGGVEFYGTSTAGTGTFTANGATASGASGGGVAFFGASTAGSATLIANGGTNAGAGGSIYFIEDSLGDTATVKVYGNGLLDIGYHNAGVTIGSLEGTGQVFLSSNNLTIGSNNTNTTFSGTVQDGSFGSGGSLTKTGTGTLILSGTNTYTGGTTITAGLLQLGDGGTTGSVIGNIANDASLVFNRSDAFTYADIVSGSGSLTQAGPGTLTLSGDNTYTGGTTISAGTLQLGAGGTTGTIIGNIANNAALVFNRSDAVAYSGIISGTGSLTQAGPGTLTLSGLNTYTGVTRVTAGTLALAGDNLLSASTTLYLTGGNLDLGGHAQTFAGLGSSSSGLAGNITAGALTTAGDSYLASGTYAHTWSGTGRLYLGGSASTVTLNGTNDSVAADHNQVIIGSSTTGAAGVVKLGNANALAAATENVHLWAGVLNLNGQANVRANSIIIESGDTSALVNLAAATTASFAGDVTLVNGKAQIGGVGNLALSGVLSGAGGFTKTSAGTLTLSALNHTYTGNTEILAGALAISGTLASGDYHGTIANSGALTFSAPSADQTLAGVISGSGSLTKSGTGTLTLSAANTYTGTTTIGGGTLTVTGSLGAGTYSGAIANSGSLIFSAPSADQTLSGVISGTGSLTKSGTGTLTLSATNTYAGGTVLNGGTLGLQVDNALGTGLLTINGGSIRSTNATRTLTNNVTVNGDFTLGRNTTLAGAIALATDITITSDNPGVLSPTSSTLGAISGAHHLTFTDGTNPTGTIILAGTNTYTGGTTISSGILQIGNGGTTGSIVGNVLDNSSLVFNRSDAITYAGVISGTGSVTHAGTGTLTLTGTNTYAGGTSALGDGAGGYATIEFSSLANLGTGNLTLDGGILKWAAGNTADISSRLNPLGYNGAVFNTNGNNVSFASALSGANTIYNYNQLVKTGAGTLTLSGGTIVDFQVAGGTLNFGTGTYQGRYLGIGNAGWSGQSGYGPSAAILSGAGTSFTSDAETNIGLYNEFSASFTISGGASFSSAGPTAVGDTSTAESTVTVTGAGTTYTSGLGFGIGLTSSGRSSVLVADGASLVSNASANAQSVTSIGSRSTGESLLTVSGPGSTFTATGNLLIGLGTYPGSAPSLTGSSSIIVSDGASASAGMTSIGLYGASGANSLTITGSGSTFTNAGTLKLATGALDNGTLNLGSAAGSAATAAGILNTATVTGGLGAAILQFNTTGTALAPTYFTRDGTSTGTGVNTTGGLSLVNTAGTTVLSGTGTQTGATIINGGTLVATQLANGSSASSIGQSTNAATNLVLNGGALRYTGAAQSTDRLFQVGNTTAGGTGTLDASGTGALAFTNTGSIAYGTTNQTRTLALTGTNTGANTLAAVIADNGTGAVSVAKSGTGTWALSGTNTYSGGTTITGGLLTFATGANLGTGNITLNGGGLQWATGASTDISSRLSAFGADGAIFDTNGNNLTFASVLSGTGAFTKSGTGTLTFSGANTYTGGTTISNGILQIGNGGTTGSIVGNVIDNTSLTFNRSDAITYAGVVSGSGSVTHTGNGTLTLTGTNTYGGGTTVSNGGLIEFTTGANLGTGNITLDFGGLKWATGTTTDVSGRLNSLGSGGTAPVWSLVGTFNTNGNDIVFNTPVTGVPGVLLEKTGTGILTLNGGTTSHLDYYVTGGTLKFATGTYEGVSVVVGDGSVLNPLPGAVPTAAVITGAGTSVSVTNGVYLGNYNALSAALTISGGASLVDLSSESRIGEGSTAESTFTVTGAGSTYTAAGSLLIGIANHGQTALVIADGGSVTTQEDIWLGTSSAAPNLITVSGAGSLLTTNGKLTLGGNLSKGSSLTISAGASASAITTVIGENTNYGFVNSLTLTGTGSKFTNTGTLTLAVSALDKGTVNLGSAVGSAATASGILDAATVTGGLGTAILQFNTTGTALAPTYFTRDGTSTGTGVNTTGGLSLVNTAGTTVLTGTGTQTGATLVNGGTLVVPQLANGGSSSSIGQSTSAATNLVLNGGALRYTGAAQSTDRLFQIGDTTAGATGTLDASGTGALAFTGTGSITYGTTNQTRTLALTGTNTGANTLAAVIADNGTGAVSLAKSGTGTWVLSGANTYSGGTTISFGTIKTAYTSALGTGPVTVSGATSILNLAGTTIANTITVQSGGSVQGTGGVGAFTIASGGNVSPGNSPGTLTAGATTFGSGGSYTWQINSASLGGAGATTGWDLLSISGALNITATSGSPFTIALASLTSGNLAGNVINFNSSVNSSYTVATASGGIGSFNANQFVIDATGFSNATNGGTWSLAAVGNDLNLNFTASAIPEPSTYAALAGACALGLAAYRKRQRRQSGLKKCSRRGA